MVVVFGGCGRGVIWLSGEAATAFHPPLHEIKCINVQKCHLAQHIRLQAAK